MNAGRTFSDLQTSGSEEVRKHRPPPRPVFENRPVILQPAFNSGASSGDGRVPETASVTFVLTHQPDFGAIRRIADLFVPA